VEYSGCGDRELASFWLNIGPISPIKKDNQSL
jgi:hypothetical protein